MSRIYFVFLLFPALLFAQTERSITSGNSELHFRTFGQGKPVLIINGGPGMNSEGFTGIAEELSKRNNAQTITYDQRGTGKSTVDSMGPESITMDLMAQDIENLRIFLKIEKWTLLGHSFGGLLAAYYASKYPQHIDRLIFSSSGGVNMKFTSYLAQRQQANLTAIQRDSLNYFQNLQSNGDTSLETIKNRAKYLAFAYVYDKSKAPIIAERLQQLNPEVNNLVFQDLLKISFDCSGSFKKFDRPVLILQGKNDIITVGTAQEIKAAFSKATLVLMDHCGHYGWLDAPDVYFKSIHSFLSS